MNKEIPIQIESLARHKNKELLKNEKAEYWVCGDKDYLRGYGAKSDKCFDCGKTIYYLDDEKEYLNKKTKKICLDCYTEHKKDGI